MTNTKKVEASLERQFKHKPIVLEIMHDPELAERFPIWLESFRAEDIESKKRTLKWLDSLENL